MWVQELLYVKRNSQGVIVGVSEEDPDDQVGGGLTDDADDNPDDH